MSSSDLSQSIGNASSAMAVGNVTYEETLGLLTAGTEITRNSNKVSRALVSVQSRYNQILDDSSSTGQKLIAFYKDHGIAIKDEKGNLRSLYDTLGDLAGKWNTLDEDQKKYFLNVQAGANQSQNLAAIMDNFDTAIAATETALNSQGSAAQENERYMESFEGKLSNLKSTFQEFATSVLNSDAMKSALDTLNSVFSTLTSEGPLGDISRVATQFGVLTGVLTGGISKFVPTLSKFVEQFKNLGDGASAAVNGFNQISSAASNTVNTIGNVANSASNVVNTVTTAADTISNTVNSVSDVAENFDEIFDVGNNFGNFGDGIQNAENAVQNIVDVADTASDSFDDLFDVGNKFGNFGDGASDVVDVLEDIGDTAGDITDDFDDLFDVGNKFGNFSDGIKDAENVFEDFQDTADNIGDVVGDVTDSLGEIGEAGEEAGKAASGGLASIADMALPLSMAIAALVVSIQQAYKIVKEETPLGKLNTEANELEGRIDSCAQEIQELQQSGADPRFIRIWQDRLKEFQSQLDETQEKIRKMELYGTDTPDEDTSQKWQDEEGRVHTYVGADTGKGPLESVYTPNYQKELKDYQKFVDLQKKMVQTGSDIYKEDGIFGKQYKIEEVNQKVKDLSATLATWEQKLQESVSAGDDWTQSTADLYEYLRKLDPEFELLSYGEISVPEQVTAVTSVKDALSSVGDVFKELNENGKLTDDQLSTVFTTLQSLSSAGVASEGINQLNSMFADGTVTAENYDSAMSLVVKDMLLTQMSEAELSNISKERLQALLESVGVTDAAAQAEKILAEAYANTADQQKESADNISKVDAKTRELGKTLTDSSNFAEGFGKTLAESTDEGAKKLMETIKGIASGEIDFVNLKDDAFGPWIDNLRKAADNGDEYAQKILAVIDKLNEAKFDINGDGALQFSEQLQKSAAEGDEAAKQWVDVMKTIMEGGKIDPKVFETDAMKSLVDQARKAAEDGDIVAKMWVEWIDIINNKQLVGPGMRGEGFNFGEAAKESGKGVEEGGKTAEKGGKMFGSASELLSGAVGGMEAAGTSYKQLGENAKEGAKQVGEAQQAVNDAVDEGVQTVDVAGASDAYKTIGEEAIKAAEKFEEANQRIVESAQVDTSGLNNIAESFDVFSSGIEKYSGLIDGLGDSFSKFAGDAATLSSNFTDFAGRIVEISTAIGTVNQGLGNMSTSVSSNFSSMATSIQTTVDNIRSVGDAVVEVAQQCQVLRDNIKAALDGAHDSATGLSSGFANLKSQTAGVTETFNSINTVATKMASSIADFGQASGDAGQRLAQAFSNASSSLTAVSGSLIGVKGTLVQVNTLVSQVSESMANLSTSATTVDTSLSSIATSASNAMSGITDGAHNAASALITLTTQSSQSVTHMNSLGTASGNAGTALGTFAANVTTATASLSNAASSMLTIAGSMNSVSMAASQASVNISSIASNLSSAAGSGALLSTSLSIVSGAASSASAGVASLATSASSCGATLSRISSSASKASSAVGKVAGPANRTSGALRKVATAANSASAALRSFAASARSVGNLTLNVSSLTSSLTAIVGKANAAAAALRNLKASASGAASAGSGALSNAQYIDTIHGMATGGTVTKEGTILVGEEGPEIVKLPSGAEVYNNDTTRQLLSKLSTSEKTHWGDFDKNKQPELPKVNNAYADWTKSVTKQYETAKGSYSDLKKSDLEKQAKEISKKIGSGAGLAQAVIDAQNKRTEAFTKQLEEQNKLYSEQIDIMEHRLFLMQKNGATEEEQIAQIRAMQAELHKQAEYYRKLGINENDTIIREIQSSWWSLEGDAQDLFQSIADAATEAAEKAKEEWQNYYEELEEGLQNKTEKYELLFEQVAKDAQRRIDDLNEEKDYWEDYYDEKIKALEEENDKIEDNIKLQELQDELAKARQKKVYVYKDGRFQYADDIDEISEAQKNLESYEREKALEDEKDRLEKLKDEAVKNIEEQINKWEEYKNEWENVVDDYQEEQNRLIIEQEFGINSEKMNWDTRIRNLSNFVSEYKEYMRQLKDAQNMQERIDKGEIFGAGTYEAGKDGKAPRGLKIGDKVVTDGGTFQIIKVNEDGTYESKKISSETRKEYASRGGTYDKASSATETSKTESSGRTYQVGKSGNAPSGLKVGDNVVTAGGTYRITKVKNDGTYESELVNNITNKDYEGTGARYDPAPSDVSWSESKGTTVSVGNDGKAPRGLKVGDRVATAGGTYKITKVKSDGTYESELIEKPISQPGQSPGGSQTKRYTGYNSSGGAYNITSQKGIDFIENAKAYATLTGGDGSYWTKNNDGSVTVNQNGNIYTVAGVGKHEKGTEKNTNPGLSLLGEKGPELGILGSGDGVIPNDLTRNLFAWGALTPDSVLKSLVNNTQSGISMNGVQMSFPNVKNGNDAEDFVKAVINIANQRAYKRR